MFGLMRESVHLLPTMEEKKQWRAHICGACYALGNEYGFLSRVFTNYDVALLSVLCEAQDPSLFKMTRRVCCPARGPRRVNVIESQPQISQYITQLSVFMAKTKFADHLADRDGIFRLIPRWVANKPLQKMRDRIGDASIWKDIEKQIDWQTELEKREHERLFAYSAPTESVTAQVFQQTAILTNRLENLVPLYHIGGVFGRVMYFVDSYQDYEKDLARGKFNPLSKCCKPSQIQGIAVQILHDCCEVMTNWFSQLTLVKRQPFCDLIAQKFEWLRSNIAACSPRSFSKKQRPKLFVARGGCVWKALKICESAPRQ